MRLATSIVAAAGVTAMSLASIARAQNTRLVFEGSVNGGPWRTNYVGADRGDEVRIRVSAHLINTPRTFLGFAGIIFQPTLSGWSAPTGDVVFPQDRFSDTRGGVGVTPGGVGRQFPFNTAAPMGTSSFAGVLTTFVDGGNTLRWSGAQNLFGGVEVVRGLGLGQLTSTILGSSFNSQAAPVLFMYKIRLGDGHRGGDQLIADAPLHFIYQARATWYTRVDGFDLMIAPFTDPPALPLRVIIPGPGAATLALAGWLAAIRRRR